MNDTRIVEFKHIPGDWHQYDIKLNFGYGWGYILKSATQLIQKDLLSVDTITTVDAKTREAKELIDAYNAARKNLEECKEARAEAGAFSEKDPSKVDRSAAYMARKIAVDCLKKYEANEVLVNIAYALGEAKPVDATAIIDGRMHKIADYDLSPRAIIEQLNLAEPHYERRVKWGHFTSGLC